jgi:hypothetical protein
MVCLWDDSPFREGQKPFLNKESALFIFPGSWCWRSFLTGIIDPVTAVSGPEMALYSRKQV